MARPMNLVHSEKKRELVEALLDKGMTLVALDGRLEGVVLPAHLRSDPQVRLNLSYRFGMPIELDEGGVRATLTFGGEPYDCELPWEAIYLAHSHVSQEQYLFLADVPDALLPRTPEEGGAAEMPGTPEEGGVAEAPGMPEEGGVAEEERAPAPPARPRLAVVQGGAEGPEPEEASSEAAEDEEAARPFAPHLRRIK